MPAPLLLAALLPVAVTAALVVVASQQLTHKPGGQLANDALFGELLNGTRAGQTFVAEHSGLYRVEVFMATYARRVQGPLVFHLRSLTTAGEDLVTVRFDAAQVRDNTFYVFEFPPLPNTAGDPFYFYLEAPGAGPGNALTVWGTRRDAYPAGRAVLRNLPNEEGVQDLTFRLSYRPGAREALREMFDRLAANKPALFGRWWVYLALVILYLEVLFWLGWALAPKPGGPQGLHDPV
ncbi:MAG: hypothetical protein ACRDH2_15735 [Anaerolineales bacterium]